MEVPKVSAALAAPLGLASEAINKMQRILYTTKNDHEEAATSMANLIGMAFDITKNAYQEAAMTAARSWETRISLQAPTSRSGRRGPAVLTVTSKDLMM